MKRILAGRWFKFSAFFLLALVGAYVVAAWHFRVWTWKDLKTYQAMSRECHPVWRDLHYGRVHPGQDMEQVIAKTAPVRVLRLGRFTMLSYQEGLCFTGVTIHARDGKVAAASAWSCTWRRTFFEEFSAEDEKDYSAAVKEYVEKLAEE
jgi:hypothetical protein